MKNGVLIFGVFIVLVGCVAFATNGQSINEAPAVVLAVAPETFPPIALAAGAHGEVIIDVKVNAAGEVVTAKSISGHPLLKKICEEAAAKWKFSSLAGSTRERTVQLSFGFETVDLGPNPKYDLTTGFRPPYKVELQHHSRIIE
ncbi:MAG TPA: energy transducer TonB [Pyrinomonadaceae bacterium]|nr:energy transducer TonB [Pyrinomonadaceae bacterium]